MPESLTVWPGFIVVFILYLLKWCLTTVATGPNPEIYSGYLLRCRRRSAVVTLKARRVQTVGPFYLVVMAVLAQQVQTEQNAEGRG